jgi:hypothetical protein
VLRFSDDKRQLSSMASAFLAASASLHSQPGATHWKEAVMKKLLFIIGVVLSVRTLAVCSRSAGAQVSSGIPEQSGLSGALVEGAEMGPSSSTPGVSAFSLPEPNLPAVPTPNTEVSGTTGVEESPGTEITGATETEPNTTTTITPETSNTAVGLVPNPTPSSGSINNPNNQPSNPTNVFAPTVVPNSSPSSTNVFAPTVVPNSSPSSTNVFAPTVVPNSSPSSTNVLPTGG